MHRHIKHLKRHRNVLYFLVVFLLVLQIASFSIMTAKVSQIHASQEQIADEIDKSFEVLRQDQQYKINEVVREIDIQREDIQESLASQKDDFERQIDFLKASEQDFSGVIERVIRGVVTISTDTSAGSGFIVHSGGYVVTNQHIIDKARFVTVKTYDGQSYDAQLVGSDASADVALLKITGVFDHINLGNSDEMQIGEKVIAIGNPLGLSFTVTEGIVSALDREGPNGRLNYIQTDVTLNRGNSGGPLINRKGEVIGMNNFKIGDAEALGFALESNAIKEAVNGFVNKTLVE